MEEDIDGHDIPVGVVGDDEELTDTNNVDVDNDGKVNGFRSDYIDSFDLGSFTGTSEEDDTT